MASPQKTRDLQREWNEQKIRNHVSVDEKYDMLVLRDKIIRAATSSSENDDLQLDMDNVVITGVCPEICPEKERYERIKQGRVDSFERRTRMIKDFSRQAADQDMPLPSELRTPVALRATMDFLLREIIADPPANPESPSGWYDFVWRRVRAIRKEITQQRLTGPAVAGILEDMCRFHLIAFHMFCEADQNQFAPKLNLENLNDCLATLGRLYTDMELRGEHSANVAEFRAYEMMIRVWTGKLDLVKTTAEVDKLPEAVQTSKEIDFARKVISAVNNRFFSEFLKLMTTADYVTSCLMHYYLPMVQAKALDFLAIASGGRSKTSNTKVSAEFFAGMLDLATGEELARFTNYHGLLYEAGNESVYFPMGFTRSRDPKQYPRVRSTTSVEAKAAGRNLAEIVAKRAFDAIPVPNVLEIDSFDENGLYVGRNPFTVSFEKENRPLDGTERFRVPLPTVAVKTPPKVFVPAITFARTSAPSPRLPSMTTSPRFPLGGTSFPATSAAGPSDFSSPSKSAMFTYTIPDRKRTRPPSIDEDDVVGDAEPKRLHHDTPPTGTSPGALKFAGSNPQHAGDKTRSPALSRQSSKSTPAKPASPSSGTQEDEADEDHSEVPESIYPNRTHLQIIRARNVCQASALLGVIFSTWRNHASRHRRPSSYFGQIDASPEQQQLVEQLQRKEIHQLTWRKYPFRSSVLSAASVGSSDVGTLLFLFTSSRHENELEEWLRTKLGDPGPSEPASLRILTYEANGRALRIVFASVQTWNRQSVNQTASAIEPSGLEVSAVLIYAMDSASLSTAKEILNRSDLLPDLPIVLFCHDETVSHAEMEADLPGTLIADVFVPQFEPTFQLSHVLWECILSVIQRRLPPPMETSTTLLALISELYCSFLRLYRLLKLETAGKQVEDNAGLIWNDLVEDYFQGVSFEITVDSERCCDRLVEMVQADELGCFLKVSEQSLWETPGRFPEVFPFGLTHELDHHQKPTYDTFAAISEKVLTVSAMASVCDPSVRQNSKSLPDFELQLRNWLEKLADDDSSCRRSQSVLSSCSDSGHSSDMEDLTPISGEISMQARKIDRDMVSLVRQDTQQLAKWFAKVSKDLKKLDSF